MINRDIVITCDTPPCEPVTGHNRKTIELIKVLSTCYSVSIIFYYTDKNEINSVTEYWKSFKISMYPLKRQIKWKEAKSLLQGYSIPTVTRNFNEEFLTIQGVLAKSKGGNVIIDFISGAPLLKYFSGGVILSGHDCMSFLFQTELKCCNGIKDKIHFYLRYRFAKKAEKKFYHKADFVHLVSDGDKKSLLNVNPEAKYEVIGLGNQEPDNSCLIPFNRRNDCVIWGNLESKPILSGVKNIFEFAEKNQSRHFNGWNLIGRIPKSAAISALPQIQKFGINYLERPDDISKFLGKAKVLLIPDINGTGQKTRTMDGLAHECAVVGFESAFSGLDVRNNLEVKIFGDPIEMVEKLPLVNHSELAALSKGGKDYFDLNLTSKKSVEKVAKFN